MIDDVGRARRVRRAHARRDRLVVRPARRGRAAGRRRRPSAAAARTSGASSWSRTRPSAASALRDADPAAAARATHAQVLVVSPALNSQLRTGPRTRTAPREQAQERLDASLARLARGGHRRAAARSATRDPLQAIEDALRTFGADEIIISTHPEGRSHWLERGVVDAARASASPSRSRTSSSTSRPSAKTSADAALLAGDRRDVLRDGRDLRRRQLALEGRHDRAAVRDLALHASRGSASGRRGSARRCRSCPRPRACGSSRSSRRRCPCRSSAGRRPGRDTPATAAT